MLGKAQWVHSAMSLSSTSLHRSAHLGGEGVGDWLNSNKSKTEFWLARGWGVDYKVKSKFGKFRLETTLNPHGAHVNNGGLASEDQKPKKRQKPNRMNNIGSSVNSIDLVIIFHRQNNTHLSLHCHDCGFCASLLYIIQLIYNRIIKI